MTAPVALLAAFAALQVGSPAAASAQACDPPAPDRHEFLIVGSVLDSITEVTLRDARITAVIASSGVGAKVHQTRAGEGGRFRLCLTRSEQLVHLYASYMGRVSHRIKVQLDAAVDSTSVILLVTGATVGRVTGRVVDAQGSQGVKAALVALQDIGITQVTDGGGNFSFGDVPPGPYQLMVSHVAYQRRTDSLSVESSAHLDVTVPIATEVIPLEPLVVKVISRRLDRVGFYRRQRSGSGTFITRANIEKLPTTAMPSDIVRGVRGMRLVARRGGRGFRLVGRNMCPYRYFVDDVRVGPGFELDDMDLHAIDGIEVYNGLGAIPPQYASVTDRRSICGVIVVWTRTR
jgi:hypothetical protein